MIALLNGDSTPSPAKTARRRGRFRLLRFFSIASLIAIGSAAVLLGFLYRQTAIRGLIEFNETNNLAMARVFANTLRPQYLSLMEASRGVSAEQLRARPEVAELHRQALLAVEGTAVVKVKVFDLAGRTLYSSEFRQIGEDRRNYPGFVAALSGKVQSHLERRESFDAFGVNIANRVVLGSYVPIRRPGSNSIDAVCEMYSDVTRSIEDIGATQTKVIAGVLAVLVVLYGVLFFIVKRADDIIRSDEEELGQAAETLAVDARQQGLIATFGQSSLKSTHLDELLSHAATVVLEGLDVDFCSVLLLAPDGRSLVLRAGSGWDTGWIGRSVAEVGADTRVQLVLGSHRPILTSDFLNGSGSALRNILAIHGVRCGMELRIGGDGSPLGILGAYSIAQRSFTQQSVDFLVAVGSIIEAAIVRSDYTEKLSRLAQFDALTGLPNRSLFKDRLSHTLTLAKRNQWIAGVIFFDLDRFKVINDTYGHGAGDALLKLVAARLQQCLRSGDTAGRLAGDEFAIVMSMLAKPDDANVVTQKVIAALALPFDLGGQVTHISASLGIALYPSDGEDPDELLKNADAAMYGAKEQGRNTYQFYTPQMNERAAERLRTETELRSALAEKQFVLYYQPKADLASGEISGIEALLRWQHPSRGMLSPVHFISILEDTGLIVPVGEWVLRAVCEQISRWRAADVAVRPVAVNVSARQFRQRDFDIVVARILKDYGIDPSVLQLEVTESMLMEDTNETVRALSKLKALGVRMSIDDFGTGYSSLAYLKRFPLDALKIDRAFVRNAASNPNDAAIVLAMIGLAHGMKLKVVAEGVETEAQLNFLKTHGCDEIQGYFLARPLPESECTRALVDNLRLRLAEVEPALGAPAVLLVDDSSDDLAMLKRMLAPDGYRIFAADTPAAAFEALAQANFQVVISDYQMPGMNGVEFLAGVRKLYPQAVRIMVSGVGEMSTVIEAVNEASVHKYLAKGLDAPRMRAEVGEAYRRIHKEPSPAVENRGSLRT